MLQDRSVSARLIRKHRKLRVVYRVTAEKTGTEQFSKMKAGDTLPIIGPLGNGFPLEAGKGKRAFLIGGGIGVPPILELAKQLDCEKQIIMGYRDADTFLKEQFEENGTVYISTEDGSVGTKGNVMDAIREMDLRRISFTHVDLLQCFAQSNNMQRNKELNVIFLWKREWRAVSGHVLRVYASQKKRITTAM